jgi:hypothetical protein
MMVIWNDLFGLPVLLTKEVPLEKGKLVSYSFLLTAQNILAFSRFFRNKPHKWTNGVFFFVRPCPLNVRGLRWDPLSLQVGPSIRLHASCECLKISCLRMPNYVWSIPRQFFIPRGVRGRALFMHHTSSYISGGYVAHYTSTVASPVIHSFLWSVGFGRGFHSLFWVTQSISNRWCKIWHHFLFFTTF